MTETTLTLTNEQASVVRTALAERWFDQAETTAGEVSATLAGASLVGIQDAAWKVREMSTVVEVFEKLGWPETGI
jgi:hypothetical protein